MGRESPPSALLRIRGAIERINTDRLEPAEAATQLHLQQSAVARYLLAIDVDSPLAGLVLHIESKGELLAWERVARTLE